MIALLLACAVECPEGSHLGEGGLCYLDDASFSSALWELEDALACDAPASAVSYTEIAFSDADWVGQQDNISLMVTNYDEEWRVITHDANSVVIFALDGTRLHREEHPFLIHRMMLSDFDGDHVPDLYALSDFPYIGWEMGNDWVRLTDKSMNCPKPTAAPLSANIIDFDGDGSDDIVMNTSNTCEGFAQGTWAAPSLIPTPAILFNSGPRKFRRVTQDTTNPNWGTTFSSVSFDANNDFAPDLYMCNDFGPKISGNAIVLNDGQGGMIFGDPRGSDVVTYCMSASISDLNNDGLLDIYLAASNEQYALVDSSFGFIDQSAAWGFSALTGDTMAWGSATGDTDNDGLVDIIVTTGIFAHAPSDDASESLHPILRNHQIRPGEWVEDGAQFGLPQEAGGRSVLMLDFNEDGVLDILFSDAYSPPHLLLSNGCTENNWIAVDAPNASRVEIEVNGEIRASLASSNNGFATSKPSVAHFGLGADAVVDRITVAVPWVGESTIEGPIEANRIVRWRGEE